MIVRRIRYRQISSGKTRHVTNGRTSLNTRTRPRIKRNTPRGTHHRTSKTHPRHSRQVSNMTKGNTTSRVNRHARNGTLRQPRRRDNRRNERATRIRPSGTNKGTRRPNGRSTRNDRRNRRNRLTGKVSKVIRVGYPPLFQRPQNKRYGAPSPIAGHAGRNIVRQFASEQNHEQPRLRPDPYDDKVRTVRHKSCLHPRRGSPLVQRLAHVTLLY